MRTGSFVILTKLLTPCCKRSRTEISFREEIRHVCLQCHLTKSKISRSQWSLTKSKKYHRLLEEELLENQKTNPGRLEEEHFQGEAHERGMLASSLQSKELSLDKNSLLCIINEGQLCSVFASLPLTGLHPSPAERRSGGREKRTIFSACPCPREPSSLHAIASPEAEPGSTLKPTLIASSFSVLLKQRSEIQAEFWFWFFLLLVTK